MSVQPVRALTSIGEALGLLRVEFSGVTLSTTRFLESEGLVHPQRSSSGYCKFSYADVERLRFILSVQRDQYLPLRVIRKRLDVLEVGQEPSPHSGSRALLLLAAASDTHTDIGRQYGNSRLCCLDRASGQPGPSRGELHRVDRDCRHVPGAQPGSGDARAVGEATRQLVALMLRLYAALLNVGVCHDLDY